MSTSTEIVRVPFHGTELLTVEADGKPHVVLRPAIEALGIDYATQLTKLKGRSWACVGQRPIQLPGDVQSRMHTTVDVRTLLMLLATVDEHRVAEHVRPLLVAYQREVADVIESYWTEGAAVRPGVTPGPQHEVPQTLAEALRLAADQLDRAEVAEAKVAEQAHELDETHAYVDDIEPDAQAFRVIATDHVGDYSAKEAACFLSRDPHIDIGQNRLLALLRGWRVLDGRGYPYAAHGRHFHLKPQVYDDPHTGERREGRPQVRITWDGLSYIRRRLLAELAAGSANARQPSLFGPTRGRRRRTAPADAVSAVSGPDSQPDSTRSENHERS